MRRTALFLCMVSAGACDGGGGIEYQTCLPDCAGTRAYDARAYALTARFDWTTRTLVASERVTLAPPAGADVVVVELDSMVDVSGVVTDDGFPLPYTVGARTLRVDVTPVVDGTTPVSFTIAYTAQTSGSL